MVGGPAREQAYQQLPLDRPVPFTRRHHAFVVPRAGPRQRGRIRRDGRTDRGEEQDRGKQRAHTEMLAQELRTQN